MFGTQAHLLNINQQSIAQIFYCECIVNINNYNIDVPETLLNVIADKVLLFILTKPSNE